MNVLLLLDMVPEYHDLLVDLGKAFNQRGHQTYYAVDSPLNLWRFRENPPVGEYRVFSEFLAGFAQGDGNSEFAWEAFFADFDRYEHYGVNWGNRQDWYCRLAAALEGFFEACVRDWKIELILYEGVTNSYSHFANRIAERHGITYIGVQASRLPGRHEYHGANEDVLRQRIKKHHGAIAAGHASDAGVAEWVAQYLANFEVATPDYMASNGLLLQDPLSKYAKFGNLSNLWRLGTYQLLRRGPADRNYRSGPPLTYSLIHAKRSAVRWARSKLLGKYFSRPTAGDRFFLYPLHFHPEASTSVNSRWYVDEYPVIKNLAFSLPPGTWLYVKDHPSAVGYPKLAFYEHVSRLPNVKLIHPGANTKQLISDSVGVITQTGTVGYEALVLRKPVWVLGEVFYDFHPGCLKVGWNEDLAKSLRQPPQAPITEAQVRTLVAAYYLATKPGALPLGSERAASASFDQLAAEIEVQVSQPE